MSQARYKIVFDGALMPDASLEQVKNNLASLFKSDRPRIDALFGKGPVALKRDLAEQEADRYLGALQRAGARVRKELDLSAGLSLIETDEERASKVTAPTTAAMACPKCGQQQAPASECSSCGVIIEKYLARQAALGESATATAQPSSAGRPPTPYAPPRANTAAQIEQVGELKVMSFQGRIGRMRYLAWSLVLMFVFIGAASGLSILAYVSETLGLALMLVAVVGLLVVSVQIGVQRLHDMGWSGWLWLLNLVPVINSIFWLIMLVVPGSVGSNRYGPPAPPNSLAVNLLGGLLLLVLIISLLTVFFSGVAALTIFSALFDGFRSGS